MTEVKTQPDLQRVIVSRLHAWRESTPTGPRTKNRLLRLALTEQDSIGWENFLYGRTSFHFAEVQQRYLRDTLNVKRTGKAWLRKLILKLYDVSWDMWQHRNAINNGGDTTTDRIAIQAADAQVEVEFERGPENLQGIDRQRLQDKGKILALPLHAKQLWLLQMELAREALPPSTAGSITRFLVPPATSTPPAETGPHIDWDKPPHLPPLPRDSSSATCVNLAIPWMPFQVPAHLSALIDTGIWIVHNGEWSTTTLVGIGYNMFHCSTTEYLPKVSIQLPIQFFPISSTRIMARLDGQFISPDRQQVIMDDGTHQMDILGIIRTHTPTAPAPSLLYLLEDAPIQPTFVHPSFVPLNTSLSRPTVLPYEANQYELSSDSSDSTANSLNDHGPEGTNPTRPTDSSESGSTLSFDTEWWEDLKRTFRQP